MGALGQAMVVPLLASLEVAENQIFAPVVLKENFLCKYDGSARDPALRCPMARKIMPNNVKSAFFTR